MQAQDEKISAFFNDFELRDEDPSDLELVCFQKYLYL